MIRSMSRTLDAGFTLKESDKQRLQASLSLQSDYDLQQYLTPKESDYVMIPVRALSATSVQNDMFNFGHLGGGPLRNSVDKFNNMIVLKDHDMTVDNWLGTSQDAYWDNSTDIPPGVNVMLKIDTKADAKVARGMLSGVLDSVSVTVSFDYEPSHPDMDEWDFYMALGTEVDGVKVQANITEIKRLYEISSVWQGADKFAKQRKQDKTLSNSLNLLLPPDPKSNKEKAVDWKKLAALMGLAQEEPTEEDITAGLTALVASNTTTKTELLTVKTEKDALHTQVVDLTAKVADGTTKLALATTQLATATANAALGEKFLAKQRTEAARLYKIVEAEKFSQPMVDMLATASLEIAESFITSYQARAEQLAPLTCSKCKGTMSGADASRRASHQSGDKPEENNGVVTTPQDARLSKSVTSIHG